MMNLSQFLKKQLSSIPRWVPISVGLVALAGFIDATYLTVEHYMNALPPCVIGDCELVLTSKFSEVAGVPVALLGAIYYLAIIVLVIIYFDTKREVFIRSALFVTTAGMLASLWFTFLQIFIIHAFCQFCLISAATSTTLFVISIISLKKYRKPATLL